MKKIIRLTETDLREIISEAVERIVKEDVLGDGWGERDPEEDDKDMNDGNSFISRKEHEFGVQGEKNIDPTQYGDYDQIKDLN